MPDLIDRVCVHALVFCPEGCHDDIDYVECNDGMYLLLDLVEQVANEALEYGESTTDANTGHDGVDDATVTAMVFMAFDAEDGYEA